MEIDHNWRDQPWRPNADEYGMPQEKPYSAGGKGQGDLANRKVYLLSTGTRGFIPHEPSDPFTHINPDRPTGRVVGTVGWEYSHEGPTPIRETPVHQFVTHGGTVTRFLDGHSEVHSERRKMLAQANHPNTHPDTRDDILDEVDDADEEHGHRNW